MSTVWWLLRGANDEVVAFYLERGENSSKPGKLFLDLGELAP